MPGEFSILGRRRWAWFLLRWVITSRSVTLLEISFRELFVWFRDKTCGKLWFCRIVNFPYFSHDLFWEFTWIDVKTQFRLWSYNFYFRSDVFVVWIIGFVCFVWVMVFIWCRVCIWCSHPVDCCRWKLFVYLLVSGFVCPFWFWNSAVICLFTVYSVFFILWRILVTCVCIFFVWI